MLRSFPGLLVLSSPGPWASRVRQVSALPPRPPPPELVRAERRRLAEQRDDAGVVLALLAGWLAAAGLSWMPHPLASSSNNVSPSRVTQRHSVASMPPTASVVQGSA